MIDEPRPLRSGKQIDLVEKNAEDLLISIAIKVSVKDPLPETVRGILDIHYGKVEVIGELLTKKR